MNKKKLLVMTSFGPVPYEAVKDYLPKEVVDKMEQITCEVPKESNPENIEFYINSIAEKKHWEYKKVASYLENLEKFSPMAVLNVLLKEIAIYCDLQYDGHISRAEEIYVISSLNGKICKADKSKIKNFNNFAAFRTVKDAEFACRVLSEKIEKMF